MLYYTTMTKTIDRKTYDEELKKFWEENGPNKGTGFFGQWAWKSKMRDKFNEELKKRGIKVEK